MFSGRCSKPLLVFFLAVIFSLCNWDAFAGGPQSQAQGQTQSPAESNPTSASKADYATSAACAVCHDDLSRKFSRNPHRALEVLPDSKWKDRECESCHGPGQAHIDAGDGSQIFSFGKSPTKDISGRCLSCHVRHAQRAGMANSLHAEDELACTECHAIHDPGHPVHLLFKAPTPLCISCHRDIAASFAQPYAHHLNQGAVGCVDCHRPHQGFGIKPNLVSNTQLQTAHGNEAACLKCHNNIRGPFVFEHFPVRTEGCTACHVPHGSANPKMLIRNQVQFLCLECHSFTPAVPSAQPPSFHNIQSPRYQNCTTCHVKIHGSNVSPAFLR
jgi:DmsE family decaheme c-type cytochrome